MLMKRRRIDNIRKPIDMQYTLDEKKYTDVDEIPPTVPDLGYNYPPSRWLH